MISTTSAPSATAATALRSTNVIDQVMPRIDFCEVDALLTPEERDVRDRVRAFVDAEVVPIITPYWERGELPTPLLPKLAALGVMGGHIKGYGCPGLSAVAAGLVSTELSRGDASVGTFHGVQSGLAMSSIALCGSEEQRRRWLPSMARMETLGAFALTEPFVGSDAAHIQTRARRDGDAYVVDGAKRWIGNGHIADVIVVWARDDDGKVVGFLVEKGTPGLSATLMAGKASLRAIGNADLTLEGVRVPCENRLGHSRDFRDTARVLTLTRYLVACAVLGNAVACYEAALAYTTRREQFGRPIAAFQLVQRKLVWMLSEITLMQLLCWRLGRLLDAGTLTAEQAALAKLNNAAKARQIAAEARDVMGGNGILLDNVVARHQADLEAMYSYEGADHIQTLVVGRKITGISAFV
jgi:glutaryl-CoA dehydrogenase